MNGFPLNAIVLDVAAELAEAILALYILRSGLGRPLTSTVVRLVWGVLQFAIFGVSFYAPIPWSGLFFGCITSYWLGASLLVGWLWWDAHVREHALSALAFRWIGAATVLNATIPLLHHWLPTVIQSVLQAGAIVVACLRVGYAVSAWGTDESATLSWFRDGRCVLNPRPRAADFLPRHPELILQMLQHSAAEDYRDALIQLIETKIERERPRSQRSDISAVLRARR